MFYLNGTLTATTAQDAAAVVAHLDAHVALTRAEPGCVSFEVTVVDALVWRLSETFVDRAAFEAHKTRAAGSPWAAATVGLVRDFQSSED